MREPFGGLLGILGVPLPGTEILIAISAILLGLAVAIAAQPPLWIAAERLYELLEFGNAPL